MQLTLVVLAAGMGSRYGGLKQMEGFGPGGETLLEFSIYDALKAGFERFVFVIRRQIEDDFRARVLSRLPANLHVELCFQELDALPEGWRVPSGRVKPWGTGHAVWVARSLLQGPFAIVNGDDFYGRDGFERLAAHFRATFGRVHAMVAYPLGKTLSETGTVSRGICVVNGGGGLMEVREVGGIRRDGQSIVCETASPVRLQEETPASMNLFGFGESILEQLHADFVSFLEAHGHEQKSEFYIPSVVNHLVAEGLEPVQVLRTVGDWMGVTNPGDRPSVVAGILRQVDAGVYPPQLWLDGCC
jgi:hypothetical protein